MHKNAALKKGMLQRGATFLESFMRKLILAVAILLLCLPVSADAKHRKRHAQRRSAMNGKSKASDEYN